MVKKLVHRAKLWTPEVIDIKEDYYLITAVECIGHKNWKAVSFSLAENHYLARTPKQCRDRWTNSLKTKNFSSFPNESEKSQIFELFFAHGNKWSLISNTIKSKSENQIKNFVNSTIRRNIRRYNEGRTKEDMIECNSLELFRIKDIRHILCADKDKGREWFGTLSLSKEVKQQIRSIEKEKNDYKDFEESCFEIIKHLDDTLDRAIKYIQKV